MITHRPAKTRAHRDDGWIETYRTFSNNTYLDFRYMQYSDLQVINDDRVQPNNHVPRHLHQNMEIFGYVVEGQCRHVDDLGNDLDVSAGSVQRMSNGTGIWHTEGNAGDVPNRYIQIWIDTAVKDTEPNYSNYTFTEQDRDNKFFDITSVLPIHQDAKFYSGIFTEEHQFTLNPQRRYYLYVVSGTATINGQASVEGDGYAFRQETQINIAPTARSEIILFDLR